MHYPTLISSPYLIPSLYKWALILSLFILNLPHSAVAQDKNQQKRIAILELANRTKHQVSLDEINYLTNEMRRVAGYLPSSKFLVMTKESIEVLIDPSKSLEDCVGVCEVETGRLLGADWILTGEVIRFGKSLRVSIKLHETRSGQYLAGESLKGKEVEDLEVPIQKSTLKLIYRISPSLEQEISAKAGPEIEKQLECLKNSSSCRSTSSRLSNRQPSRFQSGSSSSSLISQSRQSLLSALKPSSSSSTSKSTEVASDSGGGLVVDGFGFLLFGPTLALEFGQQASFRILGRYMNLGALASVALAPEDGDSFDFGGSVGIGYRKYNDRDHARRGLYWGIDVEYMHIDTSYSEYGSSFSTKSKVLTNVLHFGYRWVSDHMLIGDLFGLGLWLAYAIPLDVTQEFSDNYDWPSSYIEIDDSERVYGGISMELGWMF